MNYAFLQWFNKEKELTTDEGRRIELLRFNHTDDTNLLSEWAKHFREMYSKDELLDDFRSGTRLTRSEYLLKMVFPDKTRSLGQQLVLAILQKSWLLIFLSFYEITGSRESDMMIKQQEIVLRKVAILLE